MFSVVYALKRVIVQLIYNDNDHHHHHNHNHNDDNNNKLINFDMSIFLSLCIYVNMLTPSPRSLSRQILRNYQVGKAKTRENQETRKDKMKTVILSQN